MSAPCQIHPHPLHHHPATPCPAVTSLAVQLTHDARARTLQLTYTLTGLLDELRIPAAVRQPGAADGLWRRTCFEAFVGAPDDEAYREFNFSPSGEWAAYAFRGERVRDPAREPLPAPRVTCSPHGDVLRLDAWIYVAALPAARDTWHLGLSAVIESMSGDLSYWALRHGGVRPDFHRRQDWGVHLPVAENLYQIGL